MLFWDIIEGESIFSELPLKFWLILAVCVAVVGFITDRVLTKSLKNRTLENMMAKKAKKGKK